MVEAKRKGARVAAAVRQRWRLLAAAAEARRGDARVGVICKGVTREVM
jgi:hypothetical protein